MKNAICILFILFGSNVFSQDIVFNNVFTRNTPVIRNVLVIDNGYVVAGGDYNSSWKVEILIVKFDEFGELLWTKSYGDETYDYYHGERNALIKNSDGGFSLSGHRTNPTNGNRACMLTKFDQNFDTLWTRLYFDNPDFTAFYNHIQTPDGGYALVGSNDETDPDGDVLLVKTDSEGNMEWYKKYGTSDRDLGLCIVETEDGGYLIGGSTDGIGNGDGYLIKTDSEGNQQWARNYGNPLYPDGAIYTFAVNSQYDYYIPLTEFVIQPINKSFYSRRYSIVKLNSGFNELWNKQFGIEAEYTALGSIIIASDGDIIATVEDNYQCGMYRISSDGDSILKHYYIAPDVTNELCGLITLKQTEDQGFILCGVATSPQVMWLVKTDSCGCVVEDCECGGNDVESFWVNNEIEVYPNPAVDLIKIKCNEVSNDAILSIFSLSGQELLSKTIKDNPMSLDISDLQSGFYIIQIKTKDRIIKTKLQKL